MSRPDEENITSYLQLIEKCLTHEVRPSLGERDCSTPFTAQIPAHPLQCCLQRLLSFCTYPVASVTFHLFSGLVLVEVSPRHLMKHSCWFRVPCPLLFMSQERSCTAFPQHTCLPQLASKHGPLSSILLLPILGFHRDTEEAAAVLEAASAETPPNISAQSCTGHAELPAAEGVGGHLPRPMELACGHLKAD